MKLIIKREMQGDIRTSEWDTVGVGYGRLTVRHIFRKQRTGAWIPWVVVAPSATLKKNDVDGLGLYAARTFKRDEFVGQYPTGNVVGHYVSRQETMDAPQTRKLLRKGNDKLSAVRAGKEKGFLLLNGEGGGPPHIERVS